MATDVQPLITLGPFIGLDTGEAQEFTKPGYAIIASNVDTGRNTNALMSARGRTELFNFSMLGSPIGSIARYDVSPTQTYYIAQSSSSPWITGYWCPQTNAQGTFPNIQHQWIRAVQFQGALYLDSGHQIIWNTATIKSCQWHYAAPTGGYGYSLVSSSSPLQAATYSYAFVRVYYIPLGPNYIYQQSTPYYLSSNAQYSTNEYGTVTYTPGTLITDGTKAIELYGEFVGATPDGIAFTTDVYRMSSNTNVFNYAFTIGGDTATRIDTNSDQSIAANQQLVLNRDPPPTGVTDIGPTGTPTYNNNAIESLQDRMWVLAREQNPDTYGVPQTQLWYSNVGQGWSFDGDLQVGLVGQEKTTIQGESVTGINPLGYGDQPNALCRIASQLMVFGQVSTSTVLGTDETNYTVLPLFNNVGCVAPNSVTKIREGLVGWLGATGAYIYNQSQLIDVTNEFLKNYLETIPADHWAACVGAFRRNRWFLSFPLDNVTLVAYFSTSGGQLELNNPRWTTLPYSMTSAAWYSGIRRNSSVNAPYEQIVGARTGTQYIDYWNDADEDLGTPVILTWTSPLTTSGAPFGQKTYRTVSITAPPQPCTLQVTLAIDPGYSTSPPIWTSGIIDLSAAPTTKIFNIPNNACKGYAAQVTIAAANSPSPGPVVLTGKPVEIWKLIVGGTIDRTWVTNA